eukprot:scaffold1786_cov398-Prasinococcus_capsulatus_cf.AAC.10
MTLRARTRRHSTHAGEGRTGCAALVVVREGRPARAGRSRARSPHGSPRPCSPFSQCASTRLRSEPVRRPLPWGRRRDGCLRREGEREPLRAARERAGRRGGELGKPKETRGPSERVDGAVIATALFRAVPPATLPLRRPAGRSSREVASAAGSAEHPGSLLTYSAARALYATDVAVASARVLPSRPSIEGFVAVTRTSTHPTSVADAHSV